MSYVTSQKKRSRLGYAGAFQMELSSDSENNTANSVSHDFTTIFPNAWELGNQRWMCSFVSLNHWFSNYNISDDYGNRGFKYYNGVAWKTFNIASGNYSFPQLINNIKDNITAQGDDNTKLVMEPNYNNGHVSITYLAGYKIDFSYSNIYVTFGADARIYTNADDGELPHIAQITYNVNTFNLTISFLDGSMSGGAISNKIFTWTPDVEPGGNVDKVSSWKKALPVAQQPVVDRVRVQVVDQRNRPINLNGEPVTVILYCQPLDDW